jgi:hypothetical protein
MIDSGYLKLYFKAIGPPAEDPIKNILDMPNLSNSPARSSTNISNVCSEAG